MKYIKLLFLFLCVFFSEISYADIGSQWQVQDSSVTLYGTPENNAKSIAKITKGTILLSIFEQKDWIKVANTSNGDVGWLTKAELEKNTKSLQTAGSFTREYVIKSSDKNSPDIKIYTYSNSSPIDQQQATQMLQQIKDQQLKWQEDFNRMMNNTFSDLWSDPFFKINNNPSNSPKDKTENKPTH